MTEGQTDTQSIVGVEIKRLVSHPDDRGFFRELIRESDPVFHGGRQNFGQWSHSKMGRDTVKAWHFHHRQTDWWYCAIGVLHTVLIDLREESKTHRMKMDIFMGDPDLDKRATHQLVRIPPGVAHGCRILTDEAHLFYITDRIYDPQDEGRYPYNSSDMPHSWGEGPWVVSERDRKLFIPTYPRERAADPT